jgi:hypothetical protein
VPLQELASSIRLEAAGGEQGEPKSSLNLAGERILRVTRNSFAERLDRGVPLLAAALRDTQCHPCAGIVGFDGDEPLQQLQRLASVVIVTKAHAQIEERTRVVGVALQGEPQGGDALFGIALLQIVRTLLGQRFGFVGLLPTDDHPVVSDGHFRGSTLPDELSG